jgi:hypothetical protein
MVVWCVGKEAEAKVEVEVEVEAVLGRPVEAGKKSQEAGLRRRSRDLPRQVVADEARLGDGGAIVFQRARQVGGGQWTGGLFGQCWCWGRARAVVITMT